MRFRSRQCKNPSCRLRFPVQEDSPLGARCPFCEQPAPFVDAAWTTDAAAKAQRDPGTRISALLDNVRSLRNVGAIFRTADGAGLAHLHLCGFTPTPAHPKMAKTALGAEQSVPWTRHTDATLAVESLVEEGARVWALEGGEGSEEIFEATAALRSSDHLVLVLGHEVSGVDPRVLERCEHRVHLPMAGVKGSLNVSTAFGVAAYALRFRLARRPD